ADAGVPHVELAFVRLGEGDEFLEAVRRKVLANSEQLRLIGNKPDRLEILLRVVAQIGIERGRCAVRAHVAQDDGVTVGCGARSAERSGRATGAADVLNDELLAKMTRVDIGDDASG